MSTFNPDVLKSLGVLLAAHPQAEQQPTPWATNAAAPQAATGQPSQPPQTDASGASMLGATNAAYPPAVVAETQGDQALKAVKQGGANAQAALSAGQAAEVKGITTQEEYEQNLARAQLPEIEKRALQISAFQDKWGSVNEKLEKNIEDQRNANMAAVDDLKGTHIYNWWSQATTGAKVLGLISQALAGGLKGGFGASGPSPLDQIIHDDMEQQRLNLQQKKDTVGATQNMYDSLRARLKDETAVQQAAYEIACNSFIERTKLIAAKMGTSEAQAKAQMLIGQVTGSVAKSRAGFFSTQAGQEAETLMKSEGITEDWSKEIWGGKGHKVVSGVTGVIGAEALPAGEQKELGERLGAIKGAVGSAEGLKALINSKDVTGKPIRDSLGAKDFYDQNEQRIADIKVQALKALSTGARPSPALMDEVNKMLGEKSGFWNNKGWNSYTEAEARIDHFINTMKAIRENTVGSRVNPQTGKPFKFDDSESNPADHFQWPSGK